MVTWVLVYLGCGIHSSCTITIHSPEEEEEERKRKRKRTRAEEGGIVILIQGLIFMSQSGLFSYPLILLLSIFCIVARRFENTSLGMMWS